MEIKPPGVGISIVETDLEVDFAPPVGYQEPTPVPRSRPVLVRLRAAINLSDKFDEFLEYMILIIDD